VRLAPRRSGFRYQLRRPHVALAALAAVLGVGAVAVSHVAPPPSSLVSGCNPSFERFTYNPARLVRLADCVSVTGVVEVVRNERDGDLHVLFKVDSAYSGMLNAVNIQRQHGDLILEPDCVGGAVTQADAIGPCQGAVAPPGFNLIRAGARLKVTGPFVTDTEHGWNEVHPVEKVEVAP